MESIKNPPHERFVTQNEFCRLTGVGIVWVKKLRDEGVIPSFGRKPAYIPLVAGTEAIKEYAMKEARP